MKYTALDSVSAMIQVSKSTIGIIAWTFRKLKQIFVPEMPVIIVNWYMCDRELVKLTSIGNITEPRNCTELFSIEWVLTCTIRMGY